MAEGVWGPSLERAARTPQESLCMNESLSGRAYKAREVRSRGYCLTFGIRFYENKHQKEVLSVDVSVSKDQNANLWKLPISGKSTETMVQMSSKGRSQMHSVYVCLLL